MFMLGQWLKARQPAPQPPLFEVYRAFDGKLYQRPLALRTRLANLRIHAETLCNQAIWYCCGLLAAVAGLITYFNHLTWWDGGQAVVYCLLLAVGLVIFICKQSMRAAQAQCYKELSRGKLPLLVADPEHWLQIIALQKQLPWLKWGQSAPPRKIEEQLTFAAAYFDALQGLEKTSTLGTNTIVNGNFVWHAGRPWCFACAVLCILIPVAWVLLFPIYVLLALNAQTRKAGRLAALCEYFLGDFTLEP